MHITKSSGKQNRKMIVSEKWKSIKGKRFHTFFYNMTLNIQSVVNKVGTLNNESILSPGLPPFFSQEIPRLFQYFCYFQ